MRKRRVLFVGEASYLATGFSTYWAEVIKRIHATGEFEIAELGSYAHDGDPRNEMVPWRFYPVAPHPSDRAATQVYNSRPTNQFGEWRFTDVLLDWNPCVVATARDVWMDTFMLQSPFRKYYTFIWMPTIDGAPQREQWLDLYRQTDYILTYSQWGMDLLKRDGGPGINTVAVASPGADIDVFKPVPDKAAHKARHGIDPNAIIVGCFAPGTPVLMGDWTTKPIEQVRDDEMVMDALGKPQRVVKAHTLSHHKPMLEITVMGEPSPITLTEDHEILAVKRERVQRYTAPSRRRFIWNPCGADYSSQHDEKWIPEFVESRDLAVRDFWAFKIPTETEDRDHLLVQDWTEPAKTGRHIPERIPLNEDFLWLAGYYLANGHLASSHDCPDHSLVFTVPRSKAEIVQRIITASKSLFDLGAVVEDRAIGTFRVSIHSVEVARMFAALLGKRAATKRIHPLFSVLPPCKQLALVQGWQAGDGCVSGNRNIGVSCNFDLLIWMRLALLRNGTVASINKRSMDQKGIFANAKPQWYLRVNYGASHHEQFIHNGHLYSPIKAITPSNYDGPTYDLTVENTASYVVYSKGVHNTVMRNQRRKLYFDFCEATAKWLSHAKTRNTDLANRTYFYLHTSYPDVGYDIGKAVREFKIGKKVLMTYLCPSCGVAYPSFFAGEWTNCRACGKPGAHPPNANHGVSRETLASIMNLFDVYVQYSICEGWSMPCTEAKSLGVPVMAVNYSAMEDHCNSPGGIPINVQRFFYEPVIETEQRRALPDNEHFGQQLTRFLRMKPEQRAELSRRTREYIVEPAEVWGQTEKLPRFSYDRTAAIWANLLRTCKIKDPAETWLAPTPNLYQPDLKIPRPDMNNTEFVRWAVTSVLGRPELARSFWAGEWIKALNCGFRIETGQKVPVNHNTFVQYLLALVQERNSAELRRVASLQSSNPDQLPIEVF